MTEERNFKGIWIPKEIWLNEDLSVMEKIFLIEIDSLDNEDGCFAGNIYFAGFFKISKSRCSDIITKLVEKKYVLRNMDYKPGTKEVLKRTLKVNYSATTPIGIPMTPSGNRYTPIGKLIDPHRETDKIIIQSNNTILKKNIKKEISEIPKAKTRRRKTSSGKQIISKPENPKTTTSEKKNKKELSEKFQKKVLQLYPKASVDAEGKRRLLNFYEKKIFTNQLSEKDFFENLESAIEVKGDFMFHLKNYVSTAKNAKRYFEDNYTEQLKHQTNVSSKINSNPQKSYCKETLTTKKAIEEEKRFKAGEEVFGYINIDE